MGRNSNQLGALYGETRCEDIADPTIPLKSPMQYAKIGDGFQPANATVKSPLTAGVYKIKEYPMVGLVLEPHNLVTDKLLPFKEKEVGALITEISNFWTLKDQYDKYGFLHKRGFVLYGAPGGGKSCLLALLAEQMTETGVLTLFADNVIHLAIMLRQLRTVEPTRPIVVLMEDLEQHVRNYEHALLALMDGELQVDGVVYVATTNYIDRIPARVLRPSRFDRKLMVNMPSQKDRTTYLKNKLGFTSYKGVDLANATKGFSVADLREMIVGIFCLGNEPGFVIDELRSLNKVASTQEEDDVF